MPQHLAIFPGESWTLALLDDQSAGAGPPTPLCVVLSSAAGNISCDAGLAALGLGVCSIRIADRLFLHEPAATGSAPIAMAGDVRAVDIASTDELRFCRWSLITTTDRTAAAVDRLAREFWRSAIARLEQFTGGDALAIESVTFVATSNLPASVYPPLLSGLRAVLGRAPVVVWPPTALAGWGLIHEQTRDAAARGRSADIHVKCPHFRSSTALLAAGRSREIITRLTSQPAGACACAVDLTAESAEAEDLALALGAALWGWLRVLAAKTHSDCSADIRELDLSSAAEGAPRIAMSQFESNRESSVRYWTAAIEAVRIPGAAAALSLIWTPPWSDRPMVLHTAALGMHDLQDHWRGRIGAIARLDAVSGCGQLRLFGRGGGNERRFDFDLPTRSSTLSVSSIAADSATPQMPELPASGDDAADVTWKWCDHIDAAAIVDFPWNYCPLEAQAIPIRLLTFSRRAPALKASSEPLGSGEARISERKHVARQITLCSLRASPGSTEDAAAERKWNVTVTFLSRNKQAPPVKQIFTGSYRVCPKGYGLRLHYTPLQHDSIADAPLPLASTLGEPRRLIVAQSGVSVADPGGNLAVHRGAHGILKITNPTEFCVWVEISGASAITLDCKKLLLAPHESAFVNCTHRYTTSSSNLVELAARRIVCRVYPEDRNVSGPVSECEIRAVGNTDQEAASGFVILPAERAANWDLSAAGGADGWRLPVLVYASQPPAAPTSGRRDTLAPVQVGPPSRPELAIDAGLLIERGGTDPAGLRRAAVIIPASPVALLEWFPGPVDQLAGHLEVLAGSKDSAAASSLHPFTAKMTGAVFVQRRMHVAAIPSVPTPIPLDVLIADDSMKQVHVLWQWTGQAPGPYRCVIQMPGLAGAVAATACRGEARSERQLPAEAVKANDDKIKTLKLAIVPVEGTGLEEGAWLARLSIRNAVGVVLDEIDVMYESRVPKPNIELTIANDPESRITHATIAIRNEHPRQPLLVSRFELNSALSAIGLPLARDRRENKFDLSEPMVIDPGAQRFLEVVLRPSMLGKAWATIVRTRSLRLRMQYRYASGTTAEMRFSARVNIRPRQDSSPLTPG